MMMISGNGIGSHKHTNSVDPDQTAHLQDEQSDLDLHHLLSNLLCDTQDQILYCSF